MADDLVVRIKAEDELSQRVREAEKNVRSLKKELIAAAKEADSSGDYTRVRELEDQFRQASTQVGNLRGELKKLQRESKTTADSTVKNAGVMKTAWSKLQKVMSNPLVTAVSIGAVTLFAKSAIQSFAEVEDASSALTATFGDSGDRIIAWANESAIAFNLSRKEALTAAQTMAVFGDSAGLAGQELEQFTISLTERAAEAASYFGGTTADAIQAFGAALRGENEPIRRYGVLLDDATLRAKAFEMGLTETTKSALTPQQKTLAAYNVIMEQTTRVQGDVARTSDSMANQIKQSQAQMENFKTTVGETLAVGLAPILGALNGVLRAFNGLPQPIKTVAVAMGVLGTAALVLGPRIAAISAEMRAAGVSAAGMGSKMKGAAMFLGGPWGAALAVGTIALTHFLMEQAEANARVDEFANSIDAATGKLNQAGVAKVAETLMGDISEEDWRILEQFGFTVEGVTATVIGGADAWEAFRIQKAAAVNRAGIGKEKELLAILEGNVMGLREDVEDGTRAWEAAGKGMQIAESITADLGDTTEEMALSAGRATAVTRGLSRILPDATYKTSDYYVALSNAKDAMDGLVTSLSNLTAAVTEWGQRDSFKQALKDFVTEPTADAARSMISSFASAAESIQDPADRAQFVADNIGKVESALQSSGLKVPQSVLNELATMRSESATFLENIRLSRAALDALPDSKTVKLFLENYGTVPAWARQATGGWVGGTSGGPTSDTVPTMLSRGEYVLRGGAAAALRAAVGEAGMWALNHADRSMPSFLDSPVPPIVVPGGGGEPALVGAGAPVINIGEIKADSGIDVQTEVMWALRRADRIKRERG